jgi:hypothetical protein
MQLPPAHHAGSAEAPQGASLALLPAALGRPLAGLLPAQSSLVDTIAAAKARWFDAAVAQLGGTATAVLVRDKMEQLARAEGREAVLPQRTSHLAALRVHLSRLRHPAAV